MFTVTKTFHFSAAHSLDWIADPDHPCSRMHGHNYKVALTFEARTLDELGFVIDTHRLRFFQKWIDMSCDHQYLNDTLTSLEGETTGERMAEHMADLLLLDWKDLWHREGLYLTRVAVSETDTVTAGWTEHAPVS